MKKFILAVGLWLAATTGAWCQGTIPIALQQVVDANGKPISGALLFTFVAGTIAQQQTTFQDVALTIPNPWPLAADNNGRIPFFYLPNGSVHARLTDASGNVQFDIPTMLVIGPSSGSGSGGTVDPTSVMATGDLKWRYGVGGLSGFVRANGLTMGNATSGATERANSDTQNLFIYLYNADPNLTVSGGRTGNALNDYNSNKTITLPDWRGKVPVALADMGNSATGLFTSTFAGCTPTTLGAACGNQSQTLTAAQIPTITAANPGAIGISVLGNTPVTANGSGIGVAGAATVQIDNNFNLTSTGTIGAGAVAVQSNNTGGQAHPIIPPAMLATIYVKL